MRETQLRTCHLGLLLFLLSVAYCVLRTLRDAACLSLNAGAEVLPFIMVWGLLPAAIAMTSLFTFLFRRIGREQTFYLLVAGFASYYLLFALFLAPHHEQMRLAALEQWLLPRLPTGLAGGVKMIANWHVTLYYILVDFWAMTIIGVLFWGFTNEVMSNEEANRSYGFLKIGATASAIVGGALTLYVQVEGDWTLTLIRETYLVLALTILSLLLYRSASQRYVSEKLEKEERKVKLSLRDSLGTVRSSSYLTALAMLVVCYNLVFNLYDIYWKEQIRLAAADAGGILKVMSQLTSLVGVISVVATFSSGWIVRRFGWRTLGLITPLVMTFGAGWFLGSILLGLPLGMIVMAGFTQNGLTKAAKYSVFDVSKELAFTPLSTEEKWRGKAAIDGIGNHVGKTGCSLLQQALFLVCGSLAAATPWVALLVAGFMVVWFSAVRTLGSSPQLASSGEEELRGESETPTSAGVIS